MNKYKLNLTTPDGELTEMEFEYILVVGVTKAPQDDDTDIPLHIMGNLSRYGVGKFLLASADQEQHETKEVH